MAAPFVDPTHVQLLPTTSYRAVCRCGWQGDAHPADPSGGNEARRLAQRDADAHDCTAVREERC